MDKLIAHFTNHLEEAQAICDNTSFKSYEGTIDNVVITGLGGSGIGGKIVSNLVADQLNVPIHLNNTYFVPKFVSKNTLVIACSYSGNTEETLSAAHDALSKGAQLAIITSGGQLQEVASKMELNNIIIPGGNPPRSMLGYSLVCLLNVLKNYDLINNEHVVEVKGAVALLDENEEKIQEEAKELAAFLYNHTPVLYSDNRMEGVLIRFRQQINENAKMLCWHHILPEMNHNELVGWAGGSDQFAVVFLSSVFDYERNSTRMEVSKEIIGRYTNRIKEVKGMGKNLVEASLYHIHLEDWTSFYLSKLCKVDPIEVDVISFLKSELAKS